MKKAYSSILLAFVALTVASLVFFSRREYAAIAKIETQPAPIAMKSFAPDKTPPEPPASTKSPAKSHSFSKRLADMTDEEKAKMAKDFKERYTPVVEKWFQAYDGRVPFRLEEFTLDRFHSRLGDYMYTFMIGDVTFTIQDSPKLGLKVSYLMTRQGAIQLNKLPGAGFIPDLNVPVSREEIIRMVKTESGVEFKPNEVIVKPTAAACALNGGSFVSILPTGADPNNALNNKLSIVFGPDGKFVSYTRDPFF